MAKRKRTPAEPRPIQSDNTDVHDDVDDLTKDDVTTIDDETSAPSPPSQEDNEPLPEESTTETPPATSAPLEELSPPVDTSPPLPPPDDPPASVTPVSTAVDDDGKADPESDDDPDFADTDLGGPRSFKISKAVDRGPIRSCAEQAVNGIVSTQLQSVGSVWLILTLVQITIEIFKLCRRPYEDLRSASKAYNSMSNVRYRAVSDRIARRLLRHAKRDGKRLSKETATLVAGRYLQYASRLGKDKFREAYDAAIKCKE